MPDLRRIHLVLIVIITIISAFTIEAKPIFAVSNGCAAANLNGTSFSSFTLSLFTFSQGESVSFSISGGTATGLSILVNGTPVASGGNPGTLIYTFTTTQVYSNVRFQADPSPGAFGGTFVVKCPVTIVTSCPFSDGRLNACDAAENTAVYCLSDGSVAIWAIDNSKGLLAFTVSPEEIARAPKLPPTNTLIKEGLGARLYRLSSGELQVNRTYPSRDKDYVFRFNDCGGGSGVWHQLRGSVRRGHRAAGRSPRNDCLGQCRILFPEDSLSRI